MPSHSLGAGVSHYARSHLKFHRIKLHLVYKNGWGCTQGEHFLLLVDIDISSLPKTFSCAASPTQKFAGLQETRGCGA
jgi:hypothetical protein